MSKVRVIDMGAERIRERLADLDIRVVTVGWQGERGADTHPGSDDTPIAEVAAMIIRGTEDMPARPVFDLAIGALPSEVDLATAAEHAVKGRSGVADGLLELGAEAVKVVQRSVERVGAVDTGAVRDAVTAEIEVDR